MNKNYTVAVVGASGLVGRTILDVLSERNFPVSDVVLFASNEGSTETPYGVKEILQLNEANIYRHPCDFALLAATNEVSIKFAHVFSTLGTVVIDCSSAWRMDGNVPLVVPEVNPSAALVHSGIISAPSPIVAEILTAMAPIHREFGVTRMVISTYQSVSGAGRSALNELENGGTGVFDKPIKNNLIPKIDEYQNSGYTLEEMRIVDETHKILSSRIRVNATCVRVPITNCHGATINFRVIKPTDVGSIAKCLSESPSVSLCDEPTPLDIVGRDGVMVGRLRRDECVENTFCLWVVGDNLRKGAATNAVRIAELLT